MINLAAVAFLLLCAAILVEAFPIDANLQRALRISFALAAAIIYTVMLFWR